MRARAVVLCCVLLVASDLQIAPPASSKVLMCGGKKVTKKGTNGNDVINGTPKADVIAGRKGDDTINGLDGKDTICGGAGNDTINGGLANDKLFGQAGFDALIDHDGTNKLKGGTENDDCTVRTENTQTDCEPVTPNTPTSLDVSGSPVNDNSPEVSGTSDPGTTVRVFTSSDCSGSPVATGTANAFFVTGFTVSVADNTTTTFRAVALSPAGNPSACSGPSPAFVEDSIAPNAPSNLVTDPASPSSSNTPNLKGTADPNTIVHIFETTDCSGTSGVGGGSSDFLSPGFQLSVATDTVTTLSAHAVDDAGNVSACSSSISYTEDSTAPTQPTFTGTDPSSPGSSTTPKIQGTAEGGSTVQLYTANDCTGGVVNSGSDDTFASPGIEVSVANGNSATFWATSTDPAGNVSACSTSSISYTADTTAPTAPTITSSSPTSPADDASPEIIGTAETESTVKLYDDGTCTGTLLASGDASDFASTGLTVSVPEDATTVLSATATDEAGNVSDCSSSFSYTEQSFVYVTGHIGGDGNPGTKTSPLAEIQEGIDTAQTFSPPLDVKVSAGITYNEDITLAEGTSLFGNYVCVVAPCAWPTSPTAKATILAVDDNDGVFAAATITRNTVVDSFEIRARPEGGGFALGSRAAMTIAGGSPTVTNNLFREANNSINNNFSRTIWQTVAPASGSGPLIKNNTIRAGSSNAASSWAVYAVGAIEIDSNVINADDTSLVGSCTNPNAVTGCGGVYLDGGHGRVINNVIYGLPSSNLNSAVHAANPSGTVLIVNNYLDGRGTGSNATSAGIYVRSPSGVQTFGYIRNNILLGGSATGAYGVFEGQFPGTQAHPEAVTNNDFRSPYSEWNGSTATPRVGATIINANVANAEDNIDDDCLVDSNFQIPSGSACENAGTATDAPSTDRDGDARPFGGDVDIGPDERTS